MSSPTTRSALGQAPAVRARVRLPHKRALAWALVLPAVALLLLVGIAPTLYVLALAFARYTPGDPLLQLEFVGLQNFARVVAAQRFWSGLGVSMWFTLFSVGVQLALGMVAALAFQRVHPLLRRVAVTFVLVPMMIVPAVVGLVWRLILNETYGPVNYLAYVPFELIWPCYFGAEKACGRCESCQRDKRAFRAVGLDIAKIFEDAG